MNIMTRSLSNRVEGALMHISDNIIALKAPNETAGNTLQIYNLNLKLKLKSI